MTYDAIVMIHSDGYGNPNVNGGFLHWVRVTDNPSPAPVNQLTAGGAFPHADCGEACVRSVLINAGNDDAIVEVEHEEGAGSNGTFADQLTVSLREDSITSHTDSASPTPGLTVMNPLGGRIVTWDASYAAAFAGQTIHITGGALAPVVLAQPAVALSRTADDGGYWIVAADGGVFALGNAVFLGSLGGAHLNKPIVGMSPTPSGNGYWLVAEDGGVFCFGDARFFGSVAGTALNKPVVGIKSTSTGKGYWLVAADGGVFSKGDAVFHGSV